MRVHELARELGLRSSQEILDKLHEHGMQLKNHMSPLTDEQVDIIRKAFPKGSQPANHERS